MTIHMVMAPLPSGDAERDAERIVFIKEGFCWPAFFFAIPWLLYRAMWLVLIGYLILAIAVAAAGEIIGGAGPFVAGFAFSLLFSLEANSLRRWTLERRGWSLIGLTSGNNRDECETRFFAEWKPQERRDTASTASAPAGTSPTVRAATPTDEVIGLFPEATR